MKSQYYSNNKPNKDDPTQFKFNWSMAKNLCGYTNQQYFRNDRDKLIKLGFIKVILNGYTTRESNIYAYSSMWSKYGTDKFVVNKNEMSLPMLNQDKKLAKTTPTTTETTTTSIILLNIVSICILNLLPHFTSIF